jgi:radical SAM protein with 4Fe4S-binding SPASM domain
MFSELNLELTSKCNKHCEICLRWRDGKEKGDIPLALLEIIEKQLEDNIIIHFHNNGEPLVYPYLKDAFDIFSRQIKHFDTNGILLLEKAEDIQKVNIISVSIIQDDPLGYEQLDILRKYLSIKPDNQKVIARCVGEINGKRQVIIKHMHIPVVKRVIHNKTGRINYTKETIKPEDFICRDFLNHPAIDYLGNFYMCVKYDPKGEGILGNLYDATIKDLWYGKKRMEFLEKHVQDRNDVDFCSNCEYYGYPNY